MTSQSGGKILLLVLWDIMTASERPCNKDRDRAFGWLAPLHLYPLLTIIMGSNFGQ